MFLSVITSIFCGIEAPCLPPRLPSAAASGPRSSLNWLAWCLVSKLPAPPSAIAPPVCAVAPPEIETVKLNCPLLAAVGAEDQNPSPEIGAQLLEGAQHSGQEVKVDVYEGAGHAFFADYRPMYRPEAAARLWPELLAFLDAHLH